MELTKKTYLFADIFDGNCVDVNLTVEAKLLEKSENFRDVSKRLSLMELSIAKAEYAGDAQRLSGLTAEKALLQAQRRKILFDMNLSEEMLVPRYSCEKCNDTGFLKNGTACKCYDTGGGK